MKTSKLGSLLSILAVLLFLATVTASAAPKKILFFTKSSGYEHSVISWKSGRPSRLHVFFGQLFASRDVPLFPAKPKSPPQP